jgi:hypothetical protein
MRNVAMGAMVAALVLFGIPGLASLTACWLAWLLPEASVFDIRLLTSVLLVLAAWAGWLVASVWGDGQ